MKESMITIYLSGGIKGLSDEQAYGWRTAVKQHYKGYPIGIITPTRMTERVDMGPKTAARWICKRDKVAIAQSDIVLAYCPVPSWGTAMELHFAYDVLYKWVIVVNDEEYPSPWLMSHSDAIVPTFEDAYLEVEKVIKEMEDIQK